MKTIGRAGIAMLLIALAVVSTHCAKDKPGRAPADVSKIENNAVVVSTLWLQLVDEKEYGRSWDETADFFKRSVPRERWIGLMSSSRKPFGAVLIRALDSRKYVTSLPGAPDGEYVVITYRTKFKNKKDSVETVTPMKDRDGKWRVSGYYVK
ncbi:MAG: DUF4019 domain-containing protein [Spirochaetes bacterium]|nr:DUF4019 domain-containing protein [Spirochaetota bacterium]